MLRYCRGSICLQSSQALNSENPPPQTAEPMTLLVPLFEGDPSSPVPGQSKRPTPPASVVMSRRPLDGHVATGDDHITLCKDGTCACGSVAQPLLPHTFYLYPNPKQLPTDSNRRGYCIVSGRSRRVQTDRILSLCSKHKTPHPMNPLSPKPETGTSRASILHPPLF